MSDRTIGKDSDRIKATERSRRQRPRPRADRRRDGRPEGDGLRAVGQAAARPAATGAPKVVAVLVARSGQRRSDGDRPEVLGSATDLIFAGVIGKQLPAGMTKARRSTRLRAAGEDRLADMLSAVDVVPGQGIDFAAVGDVLLLVLAIYRRLGLARLAPGLPPQRRRPEHHLPDAVRGRGQDQPAAAALLRPPAPRRAAQPGHQRHRQHPPEPPADDEPAADLAAHRRRRGRR